MNTIRARRLGVGAAVTAVTLSLLPAVSAQADSAPQAGDVVGVGSDLIQYALDFGADGFGGSAGFNSAGNINRLISFDATADANGRAGYLNGSTFSSQLPLNPTIVLRAGTNPVLRPNGGTTGVAAFLADTAGEINFVRSPRLPTQAEQTVAQNNGWGGIHIVQIGADNLQIATAPTTNAPAGLSAAELVGIYNGTYKHWNELPGNSSGSTDTIIPLIPQNGAAVRTLFTNDLKVANGGTAVTLISGIINVEQNDPTVIAAQSIPADAIVPIPVGRIALYNSAYFKDPSKAYGTPQTTLSANVKLLTATAGDGSASYNGVAPYYIWFRQTDAVSTVTWQPGSTKNWVQTLFSSSTGIPYFKSPAGKALVAASGATATYNDLGITQSG